MVSRHRHHRRCNVAPSGLAGTDGLRAVLHVGSRPGATNGPAGNASAMLRCVTRVAYGVGTGVGVGGGIGQGAYYTLPPPTGVPPLSVHFVASRETLGPSP
jgi:hypothetical protein